MANGVSGVSTTNTQPQQGSSAGSQSTTVQKGESFSQVAKRNGISEEELKSANPSIDPKKIQQGQELALPKKSAQSQGPNGDSQAKNGDAAAGKAAEHSLEGQARAAQLQNAMDAPVDQAKVQENAKYINDKLSYKGTDWAVTDDEVREVHNKLETLPPAEYKSQIDQMKKDGVLERYIDNMGDKEKEAFLAQGAGKGYLNGGTVKVPEGPLNPPAGPQLYDNKKDLPQEMRELISERNLANAKEYDKDYSKYVDRYCKELDKCKSPEEMRALGQIAPKHPLGQEPGYDNSNTADPIARKWADERYNKTRGDKAANELAMEKMYKFTGRRPAGDVFGEVEVNAKAEYVRPTGVSMGGGYKYNVTAGTGNGIEEKETYEGRGGIDLGPVKAGGTHDTKGKTKAEFTGGPVGGSIKSDGTVEFKVKQGGSKSKDGSSSTGYGPYGSYNPNQADFRFGAYAEGSQEFKAGSGKVKVGVGGKVGVGVRGITGDEVKEAITEGPSYWKDPVELQQGKSWNDLPAETRQRYEKHYGWTEKEWQGKVPKYQQQVQP